MNEIDRSTYEYAKECALNVRNFIKYKEDMFTKQGL